MSSDPSVVTSTDIYVRSSPMDLTFLGWLHINDTYRNGGHVGVRGSLAFRTADEVKRAIRELTKLLPAVDRLGLIGEVEQEHDADDAR